MKLLFLIIVHHRYVRLKVHLLHLKNPDFDSLPIPAAGKCEVVCFTSDYDASFKDLSHKQIRTVLEAWRDRTAELSEVPYIEHIAPFENRGEEVGVTLNHPHGQIYAYS